MAAGLMLATLVRQPWHLYAHARRAGRRRQRLPRLHRPGALPAQLVRAPARPRDEPRLLRRRRRLDRAAALAADADRARRLARRLLGDGASSCWSLLVPLNLLLRRRPEDMGLEPDGDAPHRAQPTAAQPANVVDPAWAAIDWTLARALRTARFWWIALGYFCGLFAWYAVQVHQTKYLIEIGFSPTYAAWALGLRQPGRAFPARSRSAISRTASGASGCGRWAASASRSATSRCCSCATRRRRRCSGSW